MLLNSDYDVRLRLCDIRDVQVRYMSLVRNDEEAKHREKLFDAINNLTEITRDGLEKALQALHNHKISIRPGTCVTKNGASSAWDLWIENYHGPCKSGWYMRIYLFRKNEP